MTPKEVKQIVAEAQEKGERANLRGANLCGADLCDANLRGAYLRGANLRGANLCDANLRGANLCGADLCDAYLCEANLCDAKLCDANLRGANLCGADLCDANLCDANLCGAYLCDANLRGAYLCDAYLCGADLCGANNVPFIPFVCPTEGSFIGWKKASGKLVKLEIPEDAKRTSATTRKCRCNKAKVLKIVDLEDMRKTFEKVASSYDENFIYKVGEEVSVADFDEDR